jgi:uncharacterized protein (DUF3820 family)
MNNFVIPDISSLIINTGCSTNPNDIGPYHVFTFGKHSGRTILDIFKADTSYIEWLEQQPIKAKPMLSVRESIKFLRALRFNYYLNHHKKTEIIPDGAYKMPFGKHKNKLLGVVFSEDREYCKWIKGEIPNSEQSFDTWITLKQQLEFLEVRELVKLVEPAKAKEANIISDTCEQSYNLYTSGKSIEEIASQRKLKPQTVEDHLAKCVETGLITDTTALGLDIETKNYIINIISEKLCGDASKLKPIKMLADDEEENITYSQIKYAIAYMKSPMNTYK